MKRSILVLTACIAFIAASLSFMKADEPKYKNLKVLRKDISKKELDSVMRFFTQSLGEKCGFCHQRNETGRVSDFASDSNKHKDIARNMMRMTEKINKQFFKDMDMGLDKDNDHGNAEMIQAVTCYTCHRGEGEPATKPKPMRRDSMGGMPPGMPGMRPFPNDSMRNFHRDDDHHMQGDTTRKQY